MQPDQLLHESEADAAALDAAAARALDPVESLEQARQMLRRDAGTGVAHRDLRGPSIRAGPDLDRDLTFEGEFERIGNKIEDDLLPHVAVDMHRLGQRRAIQAQA